MRYILTQKQHFISALDIVISNIQGVFSYVFFPRKSIEWKKLNPNNVFTALDIVL